MTLSSSTRQPTELSFVGKAFCFTGALAHLKRTVAEREVRARGGLTLLVVNPQLDYLVIGDTPSPAWKHGSYGRKIEYALMLAAGRDRRPRLVSETEFLDGLANVAVEGDCTTAHKVVVATYKFIVAPEGIRIDADAFGAALQEQESAFGWHVSMSSQWVSTCVRLFDDGDTDVTPLGTVVTCRFVQLLDVDTPVSPLLESVQRAMEAVPDVDGTFHWFERVEGSADYVRLIRAMPSTTTMPAIHRMLQRQQTVFS